VENATATGQAHSTNSQLYGVGLAGDVKIGNYAMYVDPDNVIADSKTVDIIYRQYEDVWEKSNNGSTQGESIREMTVATTGSIEPLAFTN
ncbi:hypothetical protein ACXWPL_09430, partial [Streptococcus pyogenes]